jgi:hypothetical protein
MGFIHQLLGEQATAEWGDHSAPTKVAAYVPDSNCQAPCVQFLMDTAKSNPSKLYVRLVRSRTPEGSKITEAEIGGHCATYLINGKSTVTIKDKNGVTKEVTLEKSPESGLYTLEQLKMAVQQAMGKG